MATLKTLRRRSLRRARWTPALAASHRKLLGSAARTNSPPSQADWTTAPAPSPPRNVPATLALTSHDATC